MRFPVLPLAACVTMVCAAPVFAAGVSWHQILDQPMAWYGSDEAVRIANNVLVYQHDNGGWEKNVDMAQSLSPSKRSALEEDKSLSEHTTIDNGSTWTQLTFLARVADARSDKPDATRWRDAFGKGIDYLLRAQYPNGGWPQYFPIRKGYYTHITFNDDAMAGVLTLLRGVSQGAKPYGWVDAARRAKAARAVQKGIDCILKCQITTKGKKTAWGQQHDEVTFAPAPARKFEPPSLTVGESVGILRFLMGIPHPTPQVRESIESGVAWLQKVRLTGVRMNTIPAPGTPRGTDRVVVADPNAPPLWARLYEIGTDRPIFSGRDSVVRYRLAEIEYERRNGYAWYGIWPTSLLAKDYPAWQKTLR